MRYKIKIDDDERQLIVKALKATAWDGEWFLRGCSEAAITATMG